MHVKSTGRTDRQCIDYNTLFVQQKDNWQVPSKDALIIKRQGENNTMAPSQHWYFSRVSGERKSLALGWRRLLADGVCRSDRLHPSFLTSCTAYLSVAWHHLTFTSFCGKYFFNLHMLYLAKWIDTQLNRGHWQGRCFLSCYRTLYNIYYIFHIHTNVYQTD